MLIHKPEDIQEVLVSATRVLGTTMPYREARLQAELLLAHTLETTRAMVLARLNETISPELAAPYAANVARRAQHEPLAYILGHQEFYGLDFVVDRRVLIPRRETEMLVLLALQRVQSAPRTSPVIVDIGTGSGAVSLALAHHLPSARIIATDISVDALAVAQLNAARLNLAEHVTFVQGDLLAPVAEPFDILVSNPPYIPRERFKDLPREIRVFEPRHALDGGEDGFDVIRRLLAQLEPHAARGAVAFVEISEEQGKTALELVARQLPGAAAVVHRDLEDLDRVVEVKLPFRMS
ncbi:MAG: peptide chain release factor N(5)-glutamine methyltransferase [Chloroflexi bacterium]|nr:peptide chain release factor N(5)-glutamine methyltransferase [Chloroflexota bacterium]